MQIEIPKQYPRITYNKIKNLYYKAVIQNLHGFSVNIPGCTWELQTCLGVRNDTGMPALCLIRLV